MNLKNGKVFTSKFVGTGPSSYEKKNLPGRGLTKVEKHWLRAYCQSLECRISYTSCSRHSTALEISSAAILFGNVAISKCSSRVVMNESGSQWTSILSTTTFLDKYYHPRNFIFVTAEI